jgi:hypothetical protein
MNQYSVLNSAYPGNFKEKVTIPVIQDSLKSLTGAFAATALPSDFTFSIDDALGLADRHMRIRGRPPNPIQIVQDFTNLLRWEVSTFWRLDAAAAFYGHNTTGPCQFTQEHPRRSGELFAEGIALKFLGNWLRIPRQMIYFLEASDARPDFTFAFPARGAGLVYNGLNFGLEVRNRVSPAPLASGLARTRLGKTAYDALDKKKQNMSTHGLTGILAIYCFYGKDPDNVPALRPRLHVADPDTRPQPVSSPDIARLLVEYYLGVTSRIGLWQHYERLLEADVSLRHNRYPDPDPNVPRFSRVFGELPRTFAKQEYRGRWFSSVLALQKQLGRPAVETLVQAGQYGSVAFHGVNEAVLQLIEQFRWEELGQFYDPATGDVQVGHEIAAVTSDGVVKFEYDVDPAGQDAKDIKGELGLP